MSTSSVYFGVKDANNYYSFIEPQWLTPNEVANEFRKFSLSSCGDDSLLIYPNELILAADDSNVIDVLLLAKYRHKNGNLKLKTVLLSQILNSASASASTASSSSSSSVSSKLLILKLPKDSYYWSKVEDAHLIPKYALRAGYDHSTKQFSYIGRMKASSLLQSSMPPPSQQQQPNESSNNTNTNTSTNANTNANTTTASRRNLVGSFQQLSTSPTHRSQYRLPHYYPLSQAHSPSSSSSSSSLASTFKLKTVTNTITNLIGTLAHIYEYIPAMVLQLNDLSFLDDMKLVDFNDHRATPSASVSASASASAQPPVHQSMHTYHNHLPAALPAAQGNAAAAYGNNHRDNHHSGNKHNNNDSLWYKLKAANRNRQNLKELEFNFISNNYEVLCLKRMPATLKQMCISKLLTMDEHGYENDNNTREQEQHYEASCSLPNSIKSLLWPSYLLPGHCLVKNSKMRSSNGLYEINLNAQGALKLIKFVCNSSNSSSDSVVSSVFTRKTATFEKNIESLLISHSGVFLVYDNHQANRRPTMLYKHAATATSRPAATLSSTTASIFCSSSSSPKSTFSSSPTDDQTIPTHLKYILDTSSMSNVLLELSDWGLLRVVIRNDQRNSEDWRDLGAGGGKRPNYTVVNLIDLNDYFSGNNILMSKMSSSTSSNSMIDSPTLPTSKLLPTAADSSSGSCNNTATATLSTTIIATSTSSESSTSVNLNTSLNNIKEESIFIKLKLMADLRYLRHLPGKIFGLVSSVFKSIANTIASRL